jgi:autotransporter-associated beta strand protein
LEFDGNTRIINTNNYTAGTKFAGFTFKSTAYDFVLEGNSVNLTAGIENNSAFTQTINLPLVLDTLTPVFNTYRGNIVINSNISETGGTVGLIKTGTRLLVLNGINTYTGTTEIQAGALRTTNLPSGNLKLSGGVFESSGTFNRNLGTIAGAVQWTGNGGFSAYGGTLTVDIGGSGSTLTWGSGSFVTDSGRLVFGSVYANSTVDFLNHIDMGSMMRTVEVNNGSAFVDVDMVGDLNGTTAGLTKTGTGALRLSGDSSFSGAMIVNSGTLIVDGAISAGAGVVLANTTARLAGVGTIDRVVSGSGVVAPGLGIGILTVDQLDPSAGMDFRFDFTASAPDYTQPDDSLNDLIRITDGTPFTAALDSNNVVNLYVSDVTLTVGGTITNWFRGGFYTDVAAAFDGSITNATFYWYYKNVLQTNTPVFVRTVNSGYDFGAGTGWVMEFGVAPFELLVIPEPGVVFLWLTGLGTLYAARRRTRTSKRR